jgi:SAM-dependent methyltransferase
MSDTTHAERLAPVEQNHFWFAGRDLLVRRLLEHHGAPEPLLDLGCGTGRFAASLASDGRRVLAIDPAPDVDLAPRGATVVGSADRVPLADRSVGTVMLRDVIEHLDDEAALAECHRVLRPGGLLVLLVPAWPSLWSVRDARAGHLRRYTRASLRGAVETAGFDVVTLRGYQFALLPAVAAHRWYSARRPGHEPSASLHHEEHPPGPLNTLFGWINRAEAAMVTWPLPIPPTGTSLVLVARRS